MKKIALLPGSFDPFTLGHESLVSRGLAFVDEVVIAIGVNEQKKYQFSLEERLKMIEELYQDEERVKVCSYNGLTIDFSKQIQAQFILRGLRTSLDFEYEKMIADLNYRMSGIDTLFLFTLPEYMHISSSIVRELLHYGKDVSTFVPKTINKYIK